MKKFIYFFSVAFCCLLIVLSIFFDLSFSKTIFVGENFFSNFLEDFSEILLYIIISFAFVVFFEIRKNQNEPKQLLFKSCLIVISYLFTFLTFYTIYSATWFLFVSVILTTIIICIEIHFVSKIKEDKLKLLNNFLCKYIKFVCVIFILYYVVSLIWGRVRFIDLITTNDLESFTGFWDINFLSGHKSFYSGHTTTACALIPLICLVNELFENKKIKFTIWIFIPCFIFLVAFSRVVCGAHFISDVAFAILIALIVYFLIFEKRDKSVDNSQKDK